MSVSSPAKDAVYNSITTTLTIDAKDNFIGVCNYTMYLKDTGGFYSSGTADCASSTSISTPYYSASYMLDVFAYDLAGNYNTTQINFTTEAATTTTTTGGSGGGMLAPQKEVIERKVEVAVERCGNFVCEACDENSPLNCVDETPLSCPQDCKFFSFDDTFCFLKEGTFNCGNWLQNWFLNSVIFLVIGGLILTQYTSDKKKKKQRLG